MEGISWISCAFIVYFAISADAGPKCFHCNRVPFPRDCNHVTECGDHEVCHTQQIVSHSGHVFYDTGCLDSARCSRKRMVGNNSTVEADDEAGDLTTCLECCHGDYCNSQGCGAAPLQPFPEARGPLCFNCPKGTVAPGDCEMVTLCSIDEHCSIEPMISIGGDHLYKTGCKQCRDISDIFIGKRTTTPCNGCCKTDFCNHDCSSVSVSTGGAFFTTTFGSTLLTPSTKQAQSSTTRIVTPTTLISTNPTIPSTSSVSTVASVTPTFTSSVLTSSSQAQPSTAREVTPTSLITKKSTTLQLSSTTRLTAGTTSSNTATDSSVSSIHSQTRATAPPVTPPDHTNEMKCLLLGYEYLKNFHHCVKPYNNLKLTWQHARDRCIQDGGDLLIFHDKPEESYFESWLKNMTGTQSRYWVGASDLLQEGKWQWVDSTAVDMKLYFFNDEPNDAETNEDCAAATYHPDHRVLLNDDNCDLPSYFICEAHLADYECVVINDSEGQERITSITSGLTLPTTSSSHQHCRISGYKYDSQDGICYKVYDHEMKTMIDARASCQREHADLLQLKDRHTESYFLHQGYTFKNVNDRRYWLGGSRHSDGQFYWFNGKQVTTTDYAWGPGEPNNAQNNHEDCLEFMHYTYFPWRTALNDKNCETKSYYICEERCPDRSYTYVPALDLCFNIYTTPMTWDEAQHMCHSEHADLAEPDTLEKVHFFHRYLTTLGTRASEETPNTEFNKQFSSLPPISTFSALIMQYTGLVENRALLTHTNSFGRRQNKLYLAVCGIPENQAVSWNNVLYSIGTTEMI